MSPVMIGLAVFLDILLGDPTWFPHPVRGIGRLVSAMELWCYPRRRSVWREMVCGCVVTATVVITVGGITWTLLSLLRTKAPAAAVVVEIVLAYYCLAARSLVDSARAVLSAVKDSDLPAARQALAMIVGRDTDNLDTAEILRATIETVAENTVDGIVSPLFYLALGGPVAGIMFKAVSTMDSMIGYRNDRYGRFGTCAARLDDILNFIPARFTAFVLVPAAAIVTGLQARRSLSTVFADRLKHPSPNSAHGEAAFAGALGIRLGGPATYQGFPSDKPLLNAFGRPPNLTDAYRALTLCYTVTLLALIGAIVVARLRHV